MEAEEGTFTLIPPTDDSGNQIAWFRGSVLVGEARDSMGKELKDRHYWILVSWNEINKNPHSPVVVVPIVTLRPKTFRFVSDLEITDGRKSPTGVPVLIRCGQIRVLDRDEIKPAVNTKMCLEDTMKAVEEKIIEVLGMKRHWTRKQK